jgi:hypothetical protein
LPAAARRAAHSPSVRTKRRSSRSAPMTKAQAPPLMRISNGQRLCEVGSIQTPIRMRSRTTPSLIRMVSSGQNLVKPLWNRLAPTKAVNHSHDSCDRSAWPLAWENG